MSSLDLLHPPRLFKLRVGFPEIVDLDESAGAPSPSPLPSRVRVAAGEEEEEEGLRWGGVGWGPRERN